MSDKNENQKSTEISEVDAVVTPKIIQLLLTENNGTWQGRLLGLGNDGVTYVAEKEGWKLFITKIHETA